LKRVVASILIVAALLIGAGAEYHVSAPNSKTITSVVTSTVNSTTTQTTTLIESKITTIFVQNTSQNTAVSSATSPCGSPGVYCGAVAIVWANLTVNGNQSILEIDIQEIGSDYIGSATVYLNGTVIGVPPASEYSPPGNNLLNIQPNRTGILRLVIPQNTNPIQDGMTYPVLVYIWLGPPGQRASSGDSAMENVTAT
jgi:hypothetical protein